MKRALILLNMGGPNNLDEVKVFLKNMFTDPYILQIRNSFLRNILATIITTIRTPKAKENYALIGGSSPIVSITQKLCNRMKILQEQEYFTDIDFAMRYTPPFAKDVLKKYINFDEIVLLPLYPHHSRTTITSSVEDAKKALTQLGFNGKIYTVKHFYESEQYNSILIQTIKEALEQENSKDIRLIISAHSLPQKVINSGDLYEMHVVSHSKAIAKHCKKAGLDFASIELAYQSRLGPVKWLEPSLFKALFKNGFIIDGKVKNLKKVVILPISFCIDNSETIFELKEEYKNTAIDFKYEFYNVARCPNDSDNFAKFLLNISSENLTKLD